MKRRFPFSHDSLSNENDSKMHNPNKIFKQNPSIPKFNCTNENCRDFLTNPKFLKEDIFPEILRDVPLFLLDSNISVGISTSKPLMCDLLPGSPLEANNLFGMDIGRSSHISEVEHANINTSRAAEQCVKTIFNVKTEINVSIKQNNVSINDKPYEFQKEKDDGYLKTEKILINDGYSVEFSLNFTDEEDNFEQSIIITFFNNNKKPLNNSEDENDENKIELKNTTSLFIESDIPLIFNFSEEEDEELECFQSNIVRIIAPELNINSSIYSTYCDFLVASNLTINNNIKCKQSLLIRSNNLQINQASIETDELLIITTTTTFSSKSTLETSNLCALFANDSFTSESTNIKLSKNTFIKSRSIDFHSRKSSLTSKPNITINTISVKHNETEDEEEEEEEKEAERFNCFLQAEEIKIGPNINIKSEENFSFECTSLKIQNKNTSIDVGGKFYLLFVSDESIQKVGENNGVIKCYDLFFEVDSTDSSSPVGDVVFTNNNAITVRNSFLLSSGTFKNTGNVMLRAFYVSAFARFKNKKEDSSFKIGDFFVIESEASFLNEGRLIHYQKMKPKILNSGRMTFSYRMKNKNDKKTRGRRKSDKFLSKSEDDKKKNYSLICESFVSNGQINGDYFAVDAYDYISISGKVKCQEIDLEAQKILITKLGSVFTYKAKFRTLSFEISKGMARAANFFDGQRDFDDDDFDNDENVAGSSFEIFYQDELSGDTGKIRLFENFEIVKINDFRKNVTHENNNEKIDKKNKIKE